MKTLLNLVRKKISDASCYHKANIPPKTKAISFTFDDAPKSAFVNAQNILNDNNKKGTYYIALSFLESKPENEDYFNVEDLKKCVTNGHELACHTYSHIHLYSTKGKGIVEVELSKNRKALQEIGVKDDFLNFSYPFGEQTRQAKKVLSKRFLTCRGIDHGINRDRVDANNLKAIKLYENTHSLMKIYSLLEEFSDKGGWLVFYTHDVETNYSRFGCSPEYFEAVVKKCVELDIEIKTVKEMTQELGITKN
ncbi:polysaccharide deacetylase family protein [Reichenbachiella sp.]|uniref:polysaccharide deacetylase family protein n=1 Tax=Reichenbachiella sp. TaxID=2184521 RepID=UPI003297BED0